LVTLEGSYQNIATYVITIIFGVLDEPLDMKRDKSGLKLKYHPTLLNIPQKGKWTIILRNLILI